MRRCAKCSRNRGLSVGAARPRAMNLNRVVELVRGGVGVAKQHYVRLHMGAQDAKVLPSGENRNAEMASA